MKNLTELGFAGRGQRSAALTGASEAERAKKMIEAFSKSMSGEATSAMASTLTGSLSALEDTIMNPSVGILGMSVTFSEETQKKVNASIRGIYDQRINAYKKELEDSKRSGVLTEQRRKELTASIEQAQKTRDKLTKEGYEKISTPFSAFSFAFSRIIASLTNVIGKIGPIWETFAVSIVEFSERTFGPLAENLNAVASQMAAGDIGKAEGMGRIVGEIYKKVGELMGDLATMLTSPTGAGAKFQSEFMKGFMSAFQSDPAQLQKAKDAISRGIQALLGKILSALKDIAFSKELMHFTALFLGAMFGPPVIAGVIAGASPLIITALFKMVTGIGKKVLEAGGKVPPPAQNSQALVKRWRWLRERK
jgi:hypothetical protein